MRGNRSIMWALLLIGIGVLLLLRSSGAIPKDVRVWPVIVLVIGAWLLLDRLIFGGPAGGGFVWPLVAIAVGGVFLLQDLHRIDADVALWPVILIAVGLGVVLSAVPSRGRGAQTVMESVPLGGATSARIRLKHGAGRLSVRAMLDPDLLLQGTFAGGVDKDVVRRDGEVEVTLRQRPAASLDHVFPWNWGHGPLDWSVGLSRRVPMRLDVDAGANRADLDLSELSVSDLTVSTGASETHLTVPAKGRTAARVKAGAAAVRVRVPERTAARVVVRGGLSSTKVDETRFPRSGGEFRSSDFDAAEDRVDLEVEVGAASVEVR
jgi:hypothetical protein